MHIVIRMSHQPVRLSSVCCRQMSIMSNDPENPKKMSRRRRCSERRPLESPTEKKEPEAEKLIQAETTETGRVRDSRLPSCGGREPNKHTNTQHNLTIMPHYTSVAIIMSNILKLTEQDSNTLDVSHSMCYPSY